MPVFRRFYAAIVLVMITSLLLQPAPAAWSQVAQGATMTVLRGQVAVVREDGSAVRRPPAALS